MVIFGTTQSHCLLIKPDTDYLAIVNAPINVRPAGGEAGQGGGI